jgi:hypothetical protein
MPDFYKGKIPVVRRSLNEAFLRGEPDPEHMATGAVPRDFAVDPVEMRDSPDQMKVYDESEWDALYDKGEEAQDSLEHLYLRGDKPAFEFLDQNGFPDCWYHSTAHAAMFVMLRQGVPVVRLNAVAGATLVGRTNGGWSGLSMKHLRDVGCPPVGTGPGEWTYQSRRGKDTPELRANMRKFRGLEDWYDLGRQVYDQRLATKQIATCLFDNNPVPSDYNRASHAMLSIRLVRIERNSWGLLTLNSWPQFGYFGLCVLSLSDGWVPDGSCSLRTFNPVAK